MRWLSLSAFALCLQLAPEPPAADAAESQASIKEAHRLSDKGLREYEAGEYRKAIEDFEAAYRIYPAATLIFDIAQARRLMGDCETAASEYRRFLQLDPKAPEGPRARELAQEMERCVSAAAVPPPLAKEVDRVPDLSKPTPAEADVPAPADSADSARIDAEPPAQSSGPVPAWVAPLTAGAGLVLTGAGALVDRAAHSDFESVRSSGCAPQCDASVVHGIQRREEAGVALIAAGGAAILAAIALYLWDL
jgi:tetratricopeptide (TPR) repeat protein